MSGYEDMLSSDVSDDALGAAGTTTSVYLKVCSVAHSTTSGSRNK